MKELKHLSHKKLKKTANKRNIITSCRWFRKLTAVFKFVLFCFSEIFTGKIMESKSKDRNIFESDLDMFEFDDGFFKKIDSDLKKSETKAKQIDLLVNCNTKIDKTDYGEKDKREKKINTKCEYYDLPLFIEDFNESDFFDLSKSKNEKQSPKAIHQKNENFKKELNSNFISCPSPIQGPKSTNNTVLYPSTSTKQSHSDFEEKKQNTHQQNSIKHSYFDFLEADLFDDWNVDENNKDITEKETVTFSQALKIIEEAESAMESNLNQSVDLLTGDVVNSEIGDMFGESFGLPESAERKSSSDTVVIEEIKTECKTSTPKLDFSLEQVDDCNLGAVKESHCFSSDDDFDFLTQDLLKKPEVSKMQKNNSCSPDSPKIRKRKPLKSDLNDSTDSIIGFKKSRENCFQIIESDTTDGSPSPKFKRRNKIKKRKNSQEKFGKDFIDLEAEVSDEFKVSSDEPEEEGEYDKSFLDEESYLTQNCLANMTAKYLESVKTVTYGNFKMPQVKPYNSANVFSQIPEENNTDYEIDSFCVNDVEEEIKTDLSDLEVAEQILEINRKKRKKKRTQKIRK